jgi:squalene cyclase
MIITKNRHNKQLHSLLKEEQEERGSYKTLWAVVVTKGQK